MKKFLKRASIGLVAIGIVACGIGMLSGGLDKVDFLYFRDFVENIKLF